MRHPQSPHVGQRDDQRIAEATRLANGALQPNHSSVTQRPQALLQDVLGANRPASWPLACLDDPESLTAMASVGYGFAELEALQETPRILFRLNSLQVTFNS